MRVIPPLSAINIPASQCILVIAGWFSFACLHYFYIHALKAGISKDLLHFRKKIKSKAVSCVSLISEVTLSPEVQLWDMTLIISQVINNSQH